MSQGTSPFVPDDVPADRADTRRTNRSRLLRSIITRGPATRAELSRRIGLSRPTISVITNELLKAGVLAQGERVSSGGAPGTLLEIAKDTGVTIVADLRDADHILLATVSPSGEVLTSTRSLSRTSKQIHRAVGDFARSEQARSALGVALAVPGWVTPGGEWTAQPAHRADPSLVHALRREVRLPVFAMNAVDAIAIADLRDSDPNLAAQASVVLDHPIGMGLIMAGRLRSGVKRPAGDIAHIVPGTPGPVCRECGHRCLEPQVQALHTDHSAAAVDLAAEALAGILAPIAGAFELEELVLGAFPTPVIGDLARLTRAGLEQRMPAHQVPAVRVSAYGPEAAVVGAAAKTLYSILG
ncbi:MAG: ROK family transcriptional regulator [Micrococcales bacterium]|nr:ROK family transcriptional regulator [Micrococcales bacterium]